jgi:ubiquinone/menaquinone biosynthesis C-methylase UbiE
MNESTSNFSSNPNRGHAAPSNQEYYDDFSVRYDHGRDQGYHALIDELEIASIRDLIAGKHVLEAGCGTGLLLERMRPIAASVIGVDLSSGMLRRAQHRGFNVAQSNVTQLPFADGTFDVVCSFKVLAHVEPIESAIAELVRVTRPGGWLALEFYNPYSVRFVAKKLAGPRAISAQRNESHVYTRWDSPRAVRALLAPHARQIEFRGVRVWTPSAGVHRIPGLRQVTRSLETWSLRSPLRYAGSFLVARMQRRG